MDPALMVGGALLSGGLNAWGAHSAKKDNEKFIRDALKAYKALLAEQSVSGKQALAARTSGLDAIKSGFAGALGETQRLGDAGDVAARQYGEQALGGATQMLIDRGMYNPEQVAYWSRGVGSDVVNMLQQNYERTAAQRAGLMTQGALATAGAYGDIAGQITQNFGQRAGLSENMIGIGANRQAYSQDYSNELGWLFAGLQKMNLFGGGDKSTPSMYQGKPMSPAGPYNKWQPPFFQ